MDVTSVGDGSGIATEFSAGWADMIGIVFVVLAAFISLYPARPSVHSEIDGIWKKK